LDFALAVKNFVLVICGQKLNTHIGLLHIASALFSYCRVCYFELDSHMSHSFICIILG